jgi:hypothetical protein
LFLRKSSYPNYSTHLNVLWCCHQVNQSPSTMIISNMPWGPHQVSGLNGPWVTAGSSGWKEVAQTLGSR